MFIKQQEVVTSEEKLAASKETAEAKALVAQYHVTVLDPKKLLSPDREKATWRKKEVASRLPRCSGRDRLGKPAPLRESERA
jgi:hypothetical protein